MKNRTKYILFLVFLVSCHVLAQDSSRLERSFRDTQLNEDIKLLRKSLSADSRPRPATLQEAAYRMVETFPTDLRADALSAAQVGVGNLTCLNNVPAHARAVVFAEVFFEAIWSGRLVERLPKNVASGNKGVLLYGYFESVLNEYALIWGMRNVDHSSTLMGSCVKVGIDDVTMCLKVAALYGFSTAAGLSPKFDVGVIASLYGQ